MMRWICTDCSWQPKPGRRAHCPLCAGFNYVEAVARKRVVHEQDLRRQRAAA